MRSWRAWTVIIVFIFITLNVIYWKGYQCTDPRFCTVVDNTVVKTEPMVDNKSPVTPAPPPPPPPPPPQVAPVTPDQNFINEEARLSDHFDSNAQPIHDPNTHYPNTHDKSAEDLDMIAPTSDKTTYRLKGQEGLKYANTGDLWQFGVINTKPDVFIVSNTNYGDVNNHFRREYRIYNLMKWILRVHRRDAERTDPLVMVDAGSNHGLFSLVAGASGAHAIAFEPQTHLRSVINMAGRLNQISERLRVLPFAVLDKFRKLAMEKVEINDGGIGGLSYDKTDGLITTQTIRLDTLPSYERLFPKKNQVKQLEIPASRKADKSILEPEYLGAEYAKEIEKAVDTETTSLDESLVFRQPIHFLKIDVEGFEIPALKSAAKLFENQLVENTVLEFGPPHRWDVTVENRSDMSQKEIREITMKSAKEVLHRAINEWKLDINLLPAEGWSKTVRWMHEHGVDESEGDPTKNKVVRKLNAWKFDNLPLDNDEFEKELKELNNVVTEFIRLPSELVDPYLESSQDIGEMYLWFTKQNTDSPVLKRVT